MAGKKHSKLADYSWMGEADQEVTLALRLLCANWVSAHFGVKCKDFDEDCECCKRWKQLEDLFGDV